MCWFLLSTTSFAGKCKVVEIRISTAKSEAMFLIWKWSTHFWSETRCCPKWKNLNILFKCEGRDTLGLYRSGMVNRELNLQVKLLIYRSIYIPVLTYGHMHWEKDWRHKIVFLWRLAGISLTERVRIVIWEGLRLELLLLNIKRTQFRWFSHTTGMPPEWGVPEEAPR